MQALDRQKAVFWARKFLTHPEPRVRLQSALLVLRSGDRETATPVLAATLPAGPDEAFGRMAVQAVDELLDIGSPEATQAAASVLLNPALRSPNAFDSFSEPLRAAIVTRLARAGRPEGYRLYLDLLDVKGSQFGNATYGVPIAEQAVKEILDTLGKDDPGLRKARGIKDFETRRLEVRRCDPRADEGESLIRWPHPIRLAGRRGV